MKSKETTDKFTSARMPVRQEAVIKAGILSRTTLHRLKRKGLPTHKVGGMVFIDLAELRAFLIGPEGAEGGVN